MHELSIAQEILRIVENHVEMEERHHVRVVYLRIGSLTNILVDSLNFCFEALVDKTPLQFARLDVETVALTLACASCGHQFRPSGWASRCPQCKSSSLKTIAGYELDIKSIKLTETPAEAV